ncbi:MAG: response regulator [bacterium]
MSDKKEKILIIEDEQSLADLLAERLAKGGYETKTSYDGKDGYEQVKKFNPDLILLDIVMPKMNGYEVLEKMSEEKKKIPVIIISNSGQPVEIEKTRKLGAIDHLIKTEFSPQDVIDKVNKYISGGKKESKDESYLSPQEDPNVKKLNIKVLLVEDDSFLRDICSKKLTKEGFTVYEAIDGAQALDSAGKVEPDVILLDIVLPAVDGFQILYGIRNHSNKKINKAPVIMLSNLGQDDDIKRAMDMGANDYLVKAHFTTEEIVEKVKGVLEKNGEKK